MFAKHFLIAAMTFFTSQWFCVGNVLAADGSPNLLSNGRFDDGRSHWAIYGRPDGKGEAKLVDDGKGGSAVRLTKHENVAGPPGLHQLVALSDYESAYVLSLQFRSDDITYPNAGMMAPSLQIFFRDSKTDRTVRTITQRLPLEPGDWRTISMRFEPPREADQMQVTVISHGMVGSVLLDDFRLIKLAPNEGAWPTKRRDGEWMNHVDRQIATPHVPWGKPLAGGPLKVGMIVQRTGAREAVELAQRFDMMYDVVVAYHPTALGLPEENSTFIGTSLREKKAEVARLLEKTFDVFIVGNLQWSVLPEEIRSELTRRVQDGGMGLVILFHQDNSIPGEPTMRQREQLFTGLSVDLLRFGYEQAWSVQQHKVEGIGPKTNDERIETHQLGRGRIAHIRYTYPEELMWRGIEKHYGPYGGAALTPSVLYDGSNMHHYEVYMMLLARACQWAAKRPDLARCIPEVREPLAAGKPTTISLTITGAQKGRRCELVYTLIDNRFGISLVNGKQSVRVGRTASLKLPALPGGTYLLRYQLLNANGQTSGFGAPVLRVQSPVTFADVNIAYPDLRSGKLHIKANLTGNAAHNIHATLTDSFGRVVLRQTFTPAAFGQGIKVQVEQPVTSLHQLKLSAVDQSGAPLAVARRELFLSGAPRPDYLLGPFTGRSGYYPTYLMHLRISRDLNNNAQYEIGRWRNFSWPAMSSAARLNLQHIAGFRTLYRARPWQKNYRTQFMNAIRQDAKSLASSSLLPVGIAMGDEPNINWGYTELGFDDEALASLRGWLKQRVGSLEELNARWGTSFTSWQQVEPIRLDDVRKTGQYARWFDGWQHLTDQFTNLLRDAATEIHQHLPGVPAGFEVPIDIGVCTGYDIPRLFEHVTFYGAYQRYGHWLPMRSFAKPDAVLMSVSHARMPDPQGRQGRWQLWSSLFHGFDGHLYHRLEGSYDYAAMGYDLSVRNRWTTDKPIATQQQAADVPRHPVELVSFGHEAKRLNNGPARLVLSAKREPEPVAIFHNTVTVYASFLVATSQDKTPSASKRYSENLDAPFVMEHLLNDVHVTCRMVSDREVAAGLESLGIRVLILPRVLAMSRQTAEHIRQFVRNGGTLVAGVRPALFDELCRPQDAGLLDDVFGVRSTMKRITELAESAMTSGSGHAVPVVRFDPSVTLAGSKARGKTSGGAPVLIEHAFGRGRACLWNILPMYSEQGTSIRELVDSWGRMLDAAFGNKPVPQMGHPVLRDALRQAVEESDVPRPVNFVGSSRDLPAVELWSFARGSTKLIGLSRRNYPIHTDVEHASLKLSTRQHVYDVTEQKYLGHADRFDVPLTWGDAALIAALPDKLPAIRAVARQTAGGLSVAVSRDVSNDAYHVIAVRVIDPAGRQRTEYKRNVVMVGRSLELKLPLALNDPNGRWNVELTDAVSGQTLKVQASYNRGENR